MLSEPNSRRQSIPNSPVTSAEQQKIRGTDSYNLIRKSYISERYFQVKIEDELSDYHLILAGVQQGSVLVSLLYSIFTADVSLTDNTLIATSADDTAILSTDQDPTTASQNLQQRLNLIHLDGTMENHS
jgi:hypothetical protein